MVGFGANVSSFIIAKGDETQKLDVDIVVIPRLRDTVARWLRGLDDELRWHYGESKWTTWRQLWNGFEGTQKTKIRRMLANHKTRKYRATTVQMQMRKVLSYE